MAQPEKISRVGFVAAKFIVRGDVFFLMRRSIKWLDISFIGGHAEPRDGNKLARTAYRELLEEVPAFRKGGDIALLPLTNEFCYGPVYSRSAHAVVGYELQFFLLHLLSPPNFVIPLFGPRTPNLLVSQRALLERQQDSVAALVDLLHSVVPGGLEQIPLSWPNDLGQILGSSGRQHEEQLHLRLDYS